MTGPARLAAALAMIGLALASAACDRAPDSAAGPTAPAVGGPRIVSLSPGLSITLADLGLAGRVVGRHASDRSLDPAIRVVGDQTGIDYEVLARLEPTHIVMQTDAGGVPALLTSLAAQRGWRLVALPMLTLDDIESAVGRLAGVFADEPGVTEAAHRIRARVAEVWSEDPTIRERAGRMLVVYWTSPLGVAGPGSFHHDLARRLGARAIPETGGPYQTLDAEDLRAAAPDSIVLLTPDLTDADLARTVERWREYGIPAALEGRVAVLREWSYLTPGTAILGLAEAMRRASQPWPVVSARLTAP